MESITRYYTDMINLDKIPESIEFVIIYTYSNFPERSLGQFHSTLKTTTMKMPVNNHSLAFRNIYFTNFSEEDRTYLTLLGLGFLPVGDGSKDRIEGAILHGTVYTRAGKTSAEPH